MHVGGRRQGAVRSVLAGEALTPRVLSAIRGRVAGARGSVNMYGPTETTVYVHVVDVPVTGRRRFR